MINWIIQTDVDTENNQRLINSAKLAGHRVFEVDKDWCVWDFSYECQTYIFRGSIEKVRHIQYSDNYLIWCDKLSMFDCTSYYHKNINLLNKDFILIPKGCIWKNEDLIKNTFAGDKIFIRPNSSDKSFTGTTISKKWFQKELEIIFSVSKYTARREINNDELILFSSYKVIENEARLVVFDGKIITHSTYLGDRILTDSDLKLIDVSDCPGICTVDVAIDTLEIIEINSFSCAGLYDCDTDKIVKYFDLFYKGEEIDK